MPDALAVNKTKKIFVALSLEPINLYAINLTNIIFVINMNFTLCKEKKSAIISFKESNMHIKEQFAFE